MDENKKKEIQSLAKEIGEISDEVKFLYAHASSDTCNDLCTKLIMIKAKLEGLTM